MNYHIKDTVLTEKEFEELICTLGEHRRICRDQANDSTSKERLNLTESLIHKLITDVAIKNFYTK